MIRTGQLELIACLSVLLSGSLAGCAASAIDDPNLADDGLASEEPGEQDAGDDGDDQPTGERDASVAKDASAPPKDASTPPKDASSEVIKDAAPSTPTVDSGAAKDASTPAKDASAPAKDASAPVADASAPATPDAGKPADPPANNGQCSRDADCTNVCIAVGILPCCTIAKTCGCTWAPGAYCL